MRVYLLSQPNRKARVIERNGTQARIRFLDNKEERLVYSFNLRRA